MYTLALLACLVAQTPSPPPSAEQVFRLTTGGKVTGTLENPDESPREKYVIRTPEGGTVTLTKDQVAKVEKQSPREAEYERIRGDYPDTVEGQWQLAEWCREHRLLEARKDHLRRVIELDPDHRAARVALGYTQMNGRWATQAEIMTGRGYKYHEGRWRLPQEIEELERKDKHNRAEKDWFVKIKRYRQWLNDQRSDQALQALSIIEDPYAVEAIVAQFKREPVEDVRLVFVDVLARINDDAARKALVEISMRDESEEVRLSAIERLVKVKDEKLLGAYVAGLHSKDNLMVNRAAVALSRLGDPAAVGPLVDALITIHKFKVQQGNPGATTGSFARPDKNGNLPPGAGGAGGIGGGGLSVGSKTIVVNQEMRNPAVHDALVQLARVNFDYDVPAWKAWLATQTKPESITSRRDEAAP